MKNVCFTIIAKLNNKKELTIKREMIANDVDKILAHNKYLGFQ